MRSEKFALFLVVLLLMGMFVLVFKVPMLKAEFPIDVGDTLMDPSEGFGAEALSDGEQGSAKSCYSYYDAAAQKISVTYYFPAPIIESSDAGVTADGYVSVRMDELPQRVEPGLPVLPFMTAKVLLPFGTKFERVSATSGNKIPLLGAYVVEYGREAVRLGDIGLADAADKSVPDERVYGSSEPFPGELFSDVSVQSKMGYRILLVNLFPVEYVPETGKLFYYESIELEVEVASEGLKASVFDGRLKQCEIVEGLVDNGEVAETYLKAGKSPTYEYVIITNEELSSTPGPNNFQALRDDKISRGISATIVTVEWIYATYEGTRPDGGEDDQTRIRNFIIDAYNNWDTMYVLLGGDGDGADVGGESGDEIIPRRGFYAYDGEKDTNVPADMYYGCLDGTFDYDGDGVYGEPNDGVDGGEVDLFAEVYVGRACVDSQTEVQNFVFKTLAYQDVAPTDENLRKVCMVGEDTGFEGVARWGGNSKDEIKEGSSAYCYNTIGFENSPYNSGFDVSTLYDRDYPGNKWPQSEIIDVINDNVHLLNHVGHACAEDVMRMNYSEVDTLLTNDQLYFVGYSQACYAGAFDNYETNDAYASYDCVVEHMTTGAHGAVAFIANSRSGWGQQFGTDGASQHYDREFWDAVLGEDIFNIGIANQDSKEDNAGRVFSYRDRFCYYEINLFGDPELMIAMPFADEHELTVKVDAPYALCPGDSSLLSATVYNRGLNAETNVKLFLMIDDIEVSSATIPELPTGEHHTINYLWAPIVKATYNVTAYAPPVPGEEEIVNNVKSSMITVVPEILIVNDDDSTYSYSGGTSLEEFESALSDGDRDYMVWSESSSGRPSLSFLSLFKLVIWTCGDRHTGYSNYPEAVDQYDVGTLEAYVAMGGKLLLEGEDIGYEHDILIGDDFMWNVGHASCGQRQTDVTGLTVTDPDHPVTDGLPTSFTWFTNPPNAYADGVTPTNGGTEVIQYDGTSWTAVTVFDGGASEGSVVYYAFPLYCLAETEGQTLTINSVDWLLSSRARFDFGTDSSSVEAGYAQITEASLYSVSTGYGWANTAGLSSRDRGTPDSLRRDLVQSTTEHTFNVDLANGDYEIIITVGDSDYMHDLIDVYAEDDLEINDLITMTGEFLELSFFATVSDGQLNLKIQDDGGTDANWVINALTVQPGAPAEPLTEGYFDFGTADSPVESGYVQVTEATLYSASTGYGWTSTSGLASTNRGVAGDLITDFVHSATEHTFNVDLENGDYQISVTMSDRSYTAPIHDLIDVYAEDVQKINDLTVGYRQIQEVTFYTTVSDGQLNLRILDEGGADPSWLICALTIQPGTPPPLPTEGYFDFGTALSPVEDGYVQVIETSFYSDSWGYGWTSTAGLSSRNRGAPDLLKEDLVQGTAEHTFNVDLANGDYNVTVIIGDQSYMHDLIDVYAEDVLEIDDFNPEVGAFPALTFYTSITDGQLNLRILDDGGTDANWVINALAVEPGTPPTLPTERAFDFGPARSPVELGYIRVSEVVVYSVPTGYGWSSTSGLVSRDRLDPDYLREDFIQSTTEHMFSADLANGDYRVTVIIGDQSYMHDQIDVYAEDVLVIDDLTSTAGEFQEVTFYLTLTDEQLNLRILDDGGVDANWVINALIVQPGTPPTLPTEAAFDFGTDSSPVETDYFQVTETTMYSSVLGYGWTSTTGLQSRDRITVDNLNRDLVQSTTEHTFNVDLANGDYTVTITIGDQNYMHDQIDIYAEGTQMINDLTATAGSFMEMAFGVTIADEQLNLIILDDGGTDTNWVITALTVEPGLPPAPPTEGYFDFGTSDSPVETDYTPITESTVYSAASGYGWTSTAGLSSRDRGAPDDDLNRDLVQSTTEHTFNVDLANGDYTVTVTIGDQGYLHDNIDVYAEDIQKIDDLTATAGSFEESGFTVTVSDGQLNLRIVDDGGADGNWVINSVVIEPNFL